MVGLYWGNERGSGYTHNTPVGIQALPSHPGILVGFPPTTPDELFLALALAF